MRWSVGRKIASLSAVGIVSVMVLGFVGYSGVGSVTGKLQTVTRDNNAQQAQAEVDASHDNERWSLLDYMRAPDAAARNQAAADLKDGEDTILEKLDEVAGANLGSTFATGVERLKSEATGLQQAADAVVAAKNRGADAAAQYEQYVSRFDSFTDHVDAFTEQIQKKANVDVAAARSAASSTRHTLLAGAVLAILLSAVLAWFINRMITRPLAESVESLNALANKDLTRRIDVRTSDETARMAESLNGAVESLSVAFEAIATNAETLAAASEEVLAVSAQMGSNAAETSAQSTLVSGVADDLRVSIDSVATAVEEMTASISEIASRVSEVASVATIAVQKAAATNESVAKLGDSSHEIGKVVEVITSIAEQTKLLALNATIEAARAGESGKGFAVVANEVKDLASETARATEDIARKIETIQTDTTQAVASIQEITEIVGQINDLQHSIASSVEEQAATTNEIGSSAASAARGANDIVDNIATVAANAQNTAEGVESAQQSAVELGRMASDLKVLVADFRYDRTV